MVEEPLGIIRLPLLALYTSPDQFPYWQSSLSNEVNGNLALSPPPAAPRARPLPYTIHSDLNRNAFGYTGIFDTVHFVPTLTKTLIAARTLWRTAILVWLPDSRARGSN